MSEELKSDIMEKFSRESSPEIFMDTADNSTPEVTTEVCVTVDNESEISSSFPSNSQASSFKESDYEPSIYKCLPKYRKYRDANSMHASNFSFLGRSSPSAVGPVDYNENNDDNTSNISSSFPSDSQSSLHRFSQASSLKESDYEPPSQTTYANRESNLCMHSRLQRTHLSKGHCSFEEEKMDFDGGFGIDQNDNNDPDIVLSCPSDSQSSLLLSQSSIKDLEDSILLSQESNGANCSCYMADISSTATDSMESRTSSSPKEFWRLKKNRRYRCSKQDSITFQSHDEFSGTTTDSDIFSLTSISENDCEQLNASKDTSKKNTALQNGHNRPSRSEDFESVRNRVPENDGQAYPSTSAENRNPCLTISASFSATESLSSSRTKIYSIPCGDTDAERRHQQKVPPKRNLTHTAEENERIKGGATPDSNLSDKENETSDVSSHKRKSSDASVKSEKLIKLSKKCCKAETDDESLSEKDTDAERQRK